MKQALEDKDNALAGAQKVAREKTEGAEAKLALVGKLEEENASMKTAVEELKKELAEWAKKIEDQASAFESEKTTLTDKVDQLTQKTDRIETDLDPTKSLVKDAVALNMLRLEACLNGVQGYITHLRATMAKIGK